MRKSKVTIHREKMDAIHKINREIVAKGICPNCGTPLERNSAIAGWWQCGAYPCEDFRKSQYKNLPKCNFQCFTE